MVDPTNDVSKGVPMNRTKRRIFNTALKLFAEKGYDSTSIEEITAVSGVAKGTLYYHFSNKEEILDLLLTEGMKLLSNSIEIKIKNCSTATEKIQQLILLQIKVIVKYENLINIVLTQFWGKDKKNIKCQKCVYEYIAILEKVIQEGIENGEFYEGDIKALASGIFGVTCSSQIYRMNCNEEVSIERIYKGFVNTVVRGIRK